MCIRDRAKTEDWDGSAWTEVADVPTAHAHSAPAAQGTSLSTLSAGGGAPNLAETYEWTRPQNIKTITD